MHRRTGEQVSGTALLVNLHRERANKVFGKRQARLLEIFATACPPTKSAVVAYRRLHRRLLCSVRRIVFILTAPFVFPAAPAQYIFRDQIQFIIMFYEIMFMMFVLSSMLEYCMLGFILIMFNLVRNSHLQLSIFPTYVFPTDAKSLF